MTVRNLFNHDDANEWTTERLVAELERITGRKVHLSDDPEEHVATLKEQERQIRQEASRYYSALEQAVDSLKANNGDAQSVTAALETLWEMEPFDVQIEPPRDYGLTEHPGKSLGSVRIVVQDARLRSGMVHGHGDTLSRALVDALDSMLVHLRQIITGEPLPEDDIPF